MPKPIICPKCGEDRAIEIVREYNAKVEIFCNTCGQISIIDKD
jgi:uncharacterized Zn finger protein